MGDGDLGLYVPRGFACAAEALTDDMPPGEMLKKASMVLNSEAPSTLGTLLSFGLLAAGKTAGDDQELSNEKIVEMGQSAIDIIMKRGKAGPGDKTILDVLIPAHVALKDAIDGGSDLPDAFKSALISAKIGLDKATDMKAVHGRPGYYGDASIGKQDGGAMVGYLIYQGIVNALT
jgi:dihydroxyacetone kinase